ncbi:MAG: beta(1,3)galactosyltransferase EpsH [Clostridiaceae bacterium]|nr:beta(1,3)galactosyltransferase EpsH [Clostridiaceae bacterium]
MIFVCVGTREYQLNRLLEKLDELLEEGFIKEEVFAQIGHSTYTPKNYKYAKFINPDEFNKYLEDCRLVITHGGTGSIIGALKKGKCVVGVARLSKYGEHIDDHQKQIVELFTKEQYIYGIEEMDELRNAIDFFDHKSVIMRKYEKESYILNIIEEFIKGNY